MREQSEMEMWNKDKSKNQKYARVAIARPVTYETTKVFSVFVETYLRYTSFLSLLPMLSPVNALFGFHLRDLEKCHV